MYYTWSTSRSRNWSRRLCDTLSKRVGISFLLKNQRKINGFCIFRGPDLVDPAVDPATSVTLINLSIYLYVVWCNVCSVCNVCNVCLIVCMYVLSSSRRPCGTLPKRMGISIFIEKPKENQWFLHFEGSEKWLVSRGWSLLLLCNVM